MKSTYYVIGSINIDLNVTVERLPEPGETISGTGFSSAFGGKGANQAVALARLVGKQASSVILAGKVGNDPDGSRYSDYLKNEHIQTRLIGKSNQPTGTALIEIDKNGTNRIVVVSGANGDIDMSWWSAIVSSIENVNASLFLFQLEIPLLVICKALEDVHQKGGMTILDPAPAALLPDSVWQYVDIITPNQTETSFYTGIYPKTDDEARKAAAVFLSKGIKNVVIKAGGDGSWLFTETDAWFCPVFPVKVIDTTAAGDSCNAGFAYALGCGKTAPEALLYANAVGGISTTSAGAQGAMPDSHTVEELIRAFPKIVPHRL